jgi:hypothetical protein
MSRPCFQKLCDTIERNVGENLFCSETYIKETLCGNTAGKLASIFRAHEVTSGGFICGEVRVAITLRLLAGASYLDVAYIFGVHYNHVYAIFHHVLKYWICKDFVHRYELQDILQSEEKMYHVSKQFAKGRSSGILSGVIGALDGWLVKIQRPSLTRDGVVNSGGYFSRKGFFALNVMAIVDKKKRVLWRYIGARGSEHDSSMFKSSKLYSQLVNIALDPNGLLHNNWYEIPFYLIGDSAFGNRTFLQAPFDNAKPKTPQDVFNYIHSSCRIYVECAFGEIDSRWGIFWRPLRFKICDHKFIIDGAMRLHNFIIDHGDTEWGERDINELFLIHRRNYAVVMCILFSKQYLGSWHGCMWYIMVYWLKITIFMPWGSSLFGRRIVVAMRTAIKAFVAIKKGTVITVSLATYTASVL